MNLGAEAQSRTKWFSDPLYIAVSYAVLKTVLLIFRTVLAIVKQSKKRLAALRLIIALEHAAIQGRANIFCTELWTSVEETCNHSFLYRVFEPTITGVTLACYNNIVVAIFDLLQSYNRNFLLVSYDMYQVEVLRLAALNGSESIVQLILSNTAIVNIKGSLNLLLEDVYRTSCIRIVKLLIVYKTRYNLDSYVGSIYQAARRSYYDILSFIVRNLARTEAPYLEDTLYRVVVYSTSAIAAIYKIIAKRVSAKQDLYLEGKTFAQIIDVIFEASILSNSASNRGLLEVQRGLLEMSKDEIFQDLLLEEYLQLIQACREGLFQAVYNVIIYFGDEDTVVSNYSIGAFSESIVY